MFFATHSDSAEEESAAVAAAAAAAYTAEQHHPPPSPIQPNDEDRYVFHDLQLLGPQIQNVEQEGFAECAELGQQEICVGYQLPAPNEGQERELQQGSQWTALVVVVLVVVVSLKARSTSGCCCCWRWW